MSNMFEDSNAPLDDFFSGPGTMMRWKSLDVMSDTMVSPVFFPEINPRMTGLRQQVRGRSSNFFEDFVAG